MDNGCSYLDEITNANSGVVKNLGMDEMTNVSVIKSGEQDCPGCGTAIPCFDIVLTDCSYVIV